MRNVLVDGRSFEGVRFNFPAEQECVAFTSRLTRNFKVIRRVFQAGISVHWHHRLKPLVDEQIAAITSG